MLVEGTRLQGQRWRMVYYSNSSSQHIISFAPFPWAPFPTGWCEEGRRTPAHTVGRVTVEEPEFSSENPEPLYGQWACLPFVARETLSLSLYSKQPWKNSLEQRTVSALLTRSRREAWETHGELSPYCDVFTSGQGQPRGGVSSLGPYHVHLGNYMPGCWVPRAWVPGEGWSLGIVPLTFRGLRFQCYFWSPT